MASPRIPAANGPAESIFHWGCYVWQFNWGIFWAVLAALFVRGIWGFVNATHAESLMRGNISLDDINKRLIEIRDRLDRPS